jgi:kinesin family protein C1
VTQVDKKENYDSVEGAGLRSRVQEMQQRITQLEREKMALSMSKAPLEARFRQKEDTWLKEQKRFIQEIESLKSSSKEVDERFRDLELRYDALEEESKTLRFDARKAASTLNSQSDSTDNWSRQLQNDRDVLELKEKLRHAEYEIRALKLEKVSIESEVSATKMELDSLIRNYDELQAEFDDLEASKSQNSEAEIKLELLTTEHIATAGQLNAVCADFAATKSSAVAAMESKEKEWKAEAKNLKFEISVLKTRSAKIEDSELSMLQDGVEDDAVLKARIEERDSRIAELETQLLKGEQIRRSMHNRIQELRGNIRVFVRTRPFLCGDGQSSESSIEVLPDGEGLSIADTRNNDSHGFKFDKVFPPSAGQDSVFHEVSEFVQSALDGYNVCLFSYGQTGSGKTHTMQGSGNGAMRGIIPRAVEQILAQAQLMEKQKWQFSITASFLEIYNEELRDLLASAKSGISSSTSSRTKSAAKLAIKRNANGKSFVHGLTHIKIETNDSSIGMDQLESVMETAARARSVASTKMNAQSSRSHSVFMLHLRGQNEDDGTVVEGALNLCDLAGSERLDRSGAGTNQVRLRETQAINKSLSCLGDVFTSLSNGSSHIPYRNSKLTYLLQDCLSGDGKALMFVNLSPTIESSNESLCSLRFAKRVNQVELGKATKHVQYSGGKQ